LYIIQKKRGKRKERKLDPFLGVTACYTFLMKPKTLIWIGAFIGSTIGSYMPSLWGETVFSTSGVLLTFFGGILGIFIAYRISKND